VGSVVQQTLVFISHTQSMRSHPDGESFVDGAEEAINSVDGAKAFHMAFFPAADVTPAAYSLRQLERADVFLAVVGFAPGSPVPGDGRSYTELEFDGATHLRRPRLVFLLRPEAAYLEGVNPQRVAPLQASFRQRLESSGATVAYFTDVGDLKYKVRQAVEQQVGARSIPAGAPAPRPSPAPTSGRRPAGWSRWAALTVAVTVVLVVLLTAGLGLIVWKTLRGQTGGQTSGLGGSAADCSRITGSVLSTKPATFAGTLRGARLEVAVRNNSDASVVLPAALLVSGQGTSGRHYTSSGGLADQSWFRPVTLGAHSSTRLQLGLESSHAGSDRVTVSIPEVAREGSPFDSCTVTLPAASVTFAGT
jgi:hypothetical protein